MFFFFKQKTAYELRISDWSSDVCSSDLQAAGPELDLALGVVGRDVLDDPATHRLHVGDEAFALGGRPHHGGDPVDVLTAERVVAGDRPGLPQRLEVGRASGRERVCQYVEFSVVAVSLKKTLSQQT